jgi:hypothetical protein
LLLDYAIAVSGPFLGTETIRYQSMILYLTLLLLAAKVLQVNEFKFGEHIVAVDQNVFVMYEVLVAVIAIYCQFESLCRLSARRS